MLEERFQEYVMQHNLFTKQDKILLTVSGGVDSMVLMSLCVNSGYTVGIAHCNFSLRGEESDEDEIMVQEKARRYGIECYNKRFDTTGEMERTGESMEMAARRLRYEWFHQLCEEHGYTVIAIAHHMDDSIETFFINMLRGTGLRGLTGISKQVGRIVRPLMFATRKEILEYAHSKHIQFREDSSNLSTKYLRNKIRLGIIPRMREIMPRFSFLMHRNIERLTEAQQFIDGAIDNIFDEIAETNGDICTIHINKIANFASRKFVIYEILNSRFGFKGDTVDNLYKSLNAGSVGKRFYSRYFVAYIDRDNIVVTPIEENDLCEITINYGQHRAYCGASVLYFDICDADSLDTYHVPENVALLDISKLTFPLTLRRWQEGDTFIPFGMTGRKKVSDYLIDHKVAIPAKKRQFVMTSADNIVWLIGQRVDDRYKITPHTENVLKITREII